MVKSGALRELLGGISPRTLEKWLEIDSFPKPIWRGRDRYWFISEVHAWLKRQPRRKPAKKEAA